MKTFLKHHYDAKTKKEEGKETEKKGGWSYNIQPPYSKSEFIFSTQKMGNLSN